MGIINGAMLLGLGVCLAVSAPTRSSAAPVDVRISVEGESTERTTSGGVLRASAPSRVPRLKLPEPEETLRPRTREQAFLGLLAALTDAELARLAGEGLAEAEISSEFGRACARTLLAPVGKLYVGKTALAESRVTPPTDVTDRLPGARLHLTLHPQLLLRIGGGFTSPKPEGGGAYVAPVIGTEASDMIQWEQPELRLGAPKGQTESWTAEVELADGTTLKQAVQRLSTETGKKLFVHRSIAEVPLELSEASASAPAGEWIEAIAFATQCTFRQVGDAYVLTHHEQGLGQFAIAWAMALAESGTHWQEARRSLGPGILDRLSQLTFASSGAAIGLTPAQRAAATGDATSREFIARIEDLTEPQRDEAMQLIAALGDSAPAGVQEAMIREGLVLEVSLPGMPERAAFANLASVQLRMLAPVPQQPQTAPPAIADALLKHTAGRTLIVAPEVADLAPLIREAGFTDVWLRSDLGAPPPLAEIRTVAGSSLRAGIAFDPYSWPRESGLEPDLDVLLRTRSFPKAWDPAAVDAATPNSVSVEPKALADAQAHIRRRFDELRGAGASSFAVVVPARPGYASEHLFGLSTGLPTLGLSLRNRRSWLEEHSVDPIDLLPPSSIGSAITDALGLLASPSTEREWQQARDKEDAEAIRQLAEWVGSEEFWVASRNLFEPGGPLLRRRDAGHDSIKLVVVSNASWAARAWDSALRERPTQAAALDLSGLTATEVRAFLALCSQP